MSLSRDSVLEAAFGILDEYGLADLTMRRLADSLGVRASALYRHYDDKQSLLAAMVDVILAQVPQDADGSWRDVTVRWALGLREALLRHRDSAEVVASSRAMGLVHVDVGAAPRACFERAGMPSQQSRAAVLTVLLYVLGHVAEEQARREWARLGGSQRSEQIDGEHVGSATFGLGLGLLVDGIAVSLG